MAIQTTLSNILSKLFPRLAKVTVGGTITTNSAGSLYPTAISNEILGGHHGLDSVEDLANIPLDRLHVPMLATVKEHVVDNQIIKRTTYVLESIPTGVDRISDLPDYNISEYWKIFSAIGDFAGALEVQYAPNVDALTGFASQSGTTPPFPGSRTGIKVTQNEYNEMLEGESVLVSDLGTNVTGYWSEVFDSSKGHIWQRQRFGSGSNSTDWGIPVKVSGESYEAGDYIANVFRRATTIPSTPPQFVNGRPNNNPVGWFDTPPTANNDKLWMTKAQKDVYGQLKSPWTTPIEIIINAKLVRYNEKATPNPNSLNYDEVPTTPTSDSLTGNGWVEMYNPDAHKFMATRTEVSSGVYSQWIVIKIADESGEYVDYVFKNFDIEDTDDILNNPDGYRPQGNIPPDWSDTPVASSTTEQLFVSSARKFFNGELISEWSDPIPFSGLDSFTAVISSTPGDDFKTNPNTNTVVPNQIVLTAKLYRGVTELTTQTYEWTKIYNEGDLLDPPISLGNTPTITVLPADVIGKAVYKCVQTYQSMDFEYEISILDIADGIDAKHLQLTGNTNILLAKNGGGFAPNNITLKAYSSNLSDEGLFEWKKDGDYILNINGTRYQGNSLAVNYNDFSNDPEITYTVISKDGLEDTWTIFKTNDASTGAAAVLMILSNESHTVVQDAGTLVQDLNGAKTRVSIFEGQNDVTAQWTITKVDTGLTSTPADGANLAVGQFIQVTSIPANSTSGYVTINAVKGSQTLSKQFSINKIEDPIGSILVDIDSSIDGFVFTPSNQTPKTLTAKLYVDGIDQSSQITETEFYLDTKFSDDTIDNTIVVFPEDVEFQLTVLARVRYRGLWYSRTINITDIKDGKGLGILYTTFAVDSSGNPLTNDDRPSASVPYNAVSAQTGSVVWTNQSANAVYMTIRKEDATAWGTPIRIRGESGDQGPQGNFIMNIFRWDVTQPATPVGNPIPNGWTDAPTPNPNSGAALWMSLGEITSTTPNTIVGTWSVPVSTSGQPGIKGDEGDKGDKGDNGDPTLSAALEVRPGIDVPAPSGVPQNSNGQLGFVMGLTGVYTDWVELNNTTDIPKTALLSIEYGAVTPGSTPSTYKTGFEITVGNLSINNFGERVYTINQSWKQLVSQSFIVIPAQTMLRARIYIARTNGTSNISLTTLQAGIAGRIQIL